MQQASHFDGLSFDPFSLLQDALAVLEADIGRSEVLQALVRALLIIVVEKGIDLLPSTTGQIVVFQQDAVLQGLMPALDLAPGLRVIRGKANMVHVLNF